MSSKEQLIAGETLNPKWFKSVTQKEAIHSLRHKFEVNSIIKAWKISNGYSVPNYLEEQPTRFDELMKLKKPELADMAEGLDIDFESNAKRKDIANLIVVKEKEAED